MIMCSPCTHYWFLIAFHDQIFMQCTRNFLILIAKVWTCPKQRNSKFSCTLSLWYTAKIEEAEYWENPQVYLVPGNDEVKAHFVLHDFKATEPLNSSQLKSLKIAGTLKYMVCRNCLQIMCEFKTCAFSTNVLDVQNNTKMTGPPS